MAAESPAEDVTRGAMDDDTAGTNSSASGGTRERRQHRRLKPEELANLAARLASGAEIRLVDLSRSGAQFETDRRFLPNSTVSLRLVTADATFVVNGRVVRSRIVRLEKGGLGYNVAVAFNEILQSVIEEPAAQAAAMPPAAAATVSATPAIESTILPDASEASDPQVVNAETMDDPALMAEAQALLDAPIEESPAMLTVTASVAHTGDELRDLFNGNDW